MPATLRRLRMLSMVNEREYVRVADMSEVFGISEVTVRADLDELARSGRITRVRGGAVAATVEHRHERPFEETAEKCSTEKTAIGRFVAETMIAPGTTVLLDVGTTATAVASALARRQDLTDVVVFTNALNIALVLEPAYPRVTVVVTGGTLRPLQHSLVDPLGGLMLDRINVDVCVLGCNGVHPTGGLTNINLPEADMKRRMLRSGRRRVVVADGSKIGRVELVRLCGVEDVDLVVTGASADPDSLAELAATGLQVVNAGQP